MRRTLIALALCLGACTSAGNATRTLSLDIGTDDAERTSELLAASLRVIERRLDRMGEKLITHTQQSGDNPSLTLTVRSTEVMDALVGELAEPFTMAFMTQAEAGKGDVEVAGFGAFASSGFTEQDIDWTTVEEQENGKSRVSLILTQEGRTKLEKIYNDNKGKVIGMFVRGKLVSQLQVDGTGLKEQIVISDIPSREFADTFSDDVNVGRYVTFSDGQ